MLENVSVEALTSTNGNANEELILISKKELETLKREREEYRAMCLDFAQRHENIHKIADNIEAILNPAGGAST